MIKQRLPQKGTLDKAQPRDLFLTPNYATELLIPYIPEYIKNVWECASGTMKITNVLINNGYTVFSTDIRQTTDDVYLHNFLTDEKPKAIDGLKNLAIITNPPYSLKRQFYKKCLEYNVPFALLLSADYCQWMINAIWEKNCEKIIPDTRINFITPSGKSEATGNTSYFHSLWLTYGFGIGKSENFVKLTKEMKQNI